MKTSDKIIKGKNSEKSKNQDNFVDVDALLVNLKREDERAQKMMKNMKVMYYILIIIYSLLFVVNPDPELQMHHRISGLCYVLSFILLAILFKKYHNEFRNIDYSLPTSLMFSKAAKRYSLSIARYLAVLPSLLLIDIGITISFYYRLTNMEAPERILVVQAIYITILGISGLIGYLIWRKRQKPLRDGAMQTLKDLDEG